MGRILLGQLRKTQTRGGNISLGLSMSKKRHALIFKQLRIFWLMGRKQPSHGQMRPSLDTKTRKPHCLVIIF